MQHGFPGGPPQPPYGPPLRGRAPASDGPVDGPPVGPPDGEDPPPPRPDDPGPPREDRRPQGRDTSPDDDASPPPWEDPSRPDAPDVGADDDVPAEARPTFAEVLADQRALGRDAAPRGPGDVGPADLDDADDPDHADAVSADGAHDDGAGGHQPPPPVPAGVDPAAAAAGGWPPPTPHHPTASDPAAAAHDAWGSAPVTTVPQRSLARRVGRGLRNLVIAALVLLGVLAVIGFMIGEEEVDGAGEGAFAPVPVERCQAVTLDDAPAFPSGVDTQLEVAGDGIGAPTWAAPLGDPDRLLEPVSASGDGGDVVTVTLQERGDGGAVTSHLAVYDVTSGALQDQLHLAARQAVAVGDTRWFVGVSGGSALLFPVTDAAIATCFAANAPAGSPTPPLTSRIDDVLRPASSVGGEVAATADAAFVLTRGSGRDPVVQRLGRDGTDRTVPDLDAVRGVHADDTQLYVTRGGPDADTLDAFDPDDLSRRWRTELPDGVAVTGGPEAAATLGDTVTLALSGTDTTVVRLARGDGTVRAVTTSEDARVRTVTADATHTYAVTPYGTDGEDVTRVDRFGPDDDEAPAAFDPGGLAAGGEVALRTPDAVALTSLVGRGVLGVLLQDGEVRATTQVPIVAVGGEHLVVLRWEPGELALVGVPLAASEGGGEGDAEDEDADGEDGGGGAGDGDGDPSDAGSGDGDPSDGGPGEGDPTDGDAGDTPEGGEASGGGASAGDGGGTGGAGGAGGTGSGGSEVTEDADIDEEWLP